jgi:zinc protease
MTLDIADRIRRTARGPLASILAGLLLTACAGGGPDSSAGEAGPAALDFHHEHYVLDNGMQVVLHVDESDPLAAVALTFHVGSAREVEGRTGFAHMFEHLFFLDSENLGPGGLDRLMTRIGSATNGSTNRDRTNYFEVVPRDALEKALWAEADKVGFFINTVTGDVLAKEKQVVKNEKRQGVDNQPYGHLNYVIDRALYPEGHPYRWQVIGSLEDLDAATLDDVHAFHEQWYGPNNAVLVVAGDIDVEQTKAWIQHYFGEIPARPIPEVSEPPEVRLDETVRLMHEDNLARLPQLTLAWPGVPSYHSDAYALGLLARILTDGKTTPFHQVIVEEMELAPDVSAGHGAQELAGRFTLQVRAYEDISLDRVLGGIEAAFARFEEEGVRPIELERIKAGVERGFYQRFSSALGKAFQFAQYALFAESPGFAAEQFRRTLEVTEEDLLRVYETYLKDRPHVAASFVPRGRADLALSGSRVAEVVVEPIVQGAEEPIEVRDRGEIPRTPSQIDRSVEPPFGDPPVLTAPLVWSYTLANGLPVRGIEDRELPLVQFELRFQGGMLLDDPERVGVANLLAETMTRGTENRTPEELELAIELLGASIQVSAGRETFLVQGTTLARTFEQTMALVEEILLEPRFDPEEFERARLRVRNQIQQRSGSPNAIAEDHFNRLLYGDHILAADLRGDPTTVERISVADLREYHRRSLVPELADFHVAGAVNRQTTLAALGGLARRWEGDEVPELPADPAREPTPAGVYFVDVPGSAQSVLRIGYLAMPETDPDYWPASVMNFRLGGGGFASELTLVLREGLGYTYGIGSGFRGGAHPSPFQISSAVRSNVTLEALQVIRELLEGHGPRFTEEDLEITRGFLLRSNAMAYETLGAKLGLLADMGAYGFPPDHALRRAKQVEEMNVERIRELARRYLDTSRMVWLVVGDAETQLERLTALDLGEPRLLAPESLGANGGG